MLGPRRVLAGLALAGVAWLSGGLALAQAPEPVPPTPAPEPATPEPVAPPEPPAPPTLSQSLTGLAKAEYEAARILFTDGDYGNAIIKFQRSHELSGDPRLLWNIAVCEKNLRRYTKMRRSIRRYVAQAGKVLTPANLEQVDAILATTREFVSDLQLATKPDGAEVWVDGELVGETPLPEGTTLDVGSRDIEVRKVGFETVKQTIPVVGGTPVELRLTLAKIQRRGRLEVVAGEEDFIFLDDKMVARGRYDGALLGGGHRLRVTGRDKSPHESEVVIQPGGTRRLEVELEDRAVSTASILWIVGGVTVAAAGVLTGALLFEPSTEVTPGTVPPGTVQLGAW